MATGGFRARDLDAVAHGVRDFDRRRILSPNSGKAGRIDCSTGRSVRGVRGSYARSQASGKRDRRSRLYHTIHEVAPPDGPVHA